MKKLIVIPLFISLIIGINGFDYVSILNVNFSSGAMMSGAVESVDINDYQTILTNPSLLSFAQWNFVRVNYLNYIMDTNFSYLGFGKYIEGLGNVAISYLYGNYGFQINRDASGNDLGQFFSYDQAIVLTLSDMIYNKTYMGFNIKYLQAQFGDYKSSSMLFDFGLSFRVKRLLIGMYLKNFGTKMEFQQYGDNNQVVAGIGFRYRYNFKSRKVSFILLNDYNIYGDTMLINAGFKFILFKNLILGSGVNNITDNYTRRINMGLSYNLKRIGVNFTYGYNGNYASIYSAGMEYRW